MPGNANGGPRPRSSGTAGRQAKRNPPQPPPDRAPLPGTKAPPTLQHSMCPVPAQRDTGPCPAPPSPAPPSRAAAIGCAVGSGPPVASCCRLPHFLRASRGPALAPGDPRGVARAERRRGRGLAQGAQALAAGNKGWGRPRRKQRARSPAAVPAWNPRQPESPAAPAPGLFFFFFPSFFLFFNTAEPPARSPSPLLRSASLFLSRRSRPAR